MFSVLIKTHSRWKWWLWKMCIARLVYIYKKRTLDLIFIKKKKEERKKNQFTGNKVLFVPWLLKAKSISKAVCMLPLAVQRASSIRQASITGKASLKIFVCGSWNGFVIVKIKKSGEKSYFYTLSKFKFFSIYSNFFFVKQCAFTKYS